MQCKTISPKELQIFYDDYKGDKTFLQSAKFGAWRESLGEQILYKGFFEGKTLKATALIQGITSRFKTYLHCPHGPLIAPWDLTLWEYFLHQYKDLGDERKVDLIRISPLLIIDNQEIYPTFGTIGFVPAATHLVNPEHTLVLDITQSEETILAQMRKSTRYEVNRIEKSGITVDQGNSPNDLDIFWKLHAETVSRQKFVPFPLSNTKKELKAFGDDCLIFNSKIEDKYYSSAIILFDKRAAYYHQGASKHCKLPCSHATIWSAIKEAKARGCTEFNFWGVVDDQAKKHPWYGLSKFKRGFGGEERKYLHVQDFQYTLKGKLNRSIETFRKWKRGY
ncbi:MAG TPA: peptidoglycan bridge formation glycyltransferase FemA/FemB family protein [Candidatus Gracilibacteria bacterium]